MSFALPVARGARLRLAAPDDLVRDQPRSHLQKYEEYKRGLGETRASSEAGGHAFHVFSPITREELLSVRVHEDAGR